MDGASKFVRGDAIAGIIITFVNVLGGFTSECSSTIGACSIASLFTPNCPSATAWPARSRRSSCRLAAGLIITRTSSKTNLGDEVISQVFAKPKALFIACIFIVLMMFTGLPKVPLFILGTCCGILSVTLSRRPEGSRPSATAAHEKDKTAKKEPEKIEKVLDLDTMELEVGYGLVRLVDAAKGGDLLDRISMVRRQVAIDLGIIVPPVRIRDNIQLGANDYVVRIKGQVVGKGVAYPEQFLAMDNGATDRSRSPAALRPPSLPSA